MKKEKIFRSSIYATALVGLAAFLVFSILAAVTFGNADLSLKDVYSVILYKIFHIKISIPPPSAGGTNSNESVSTLYVVL